MAYSTPNLLYQQVVALTSRFGEIDQKLIQINERIAGFEVQLTTLTNITAAIINFVQQMNIATNDDKQAFRSLINSPVKTLPPKQEILNKIHILQLTLKTLKELVNPKVMEALTDKIHKFNPSCIPLEW